jgi:hypothetical protein
VKEAFDRDDAHLRAASSPVPFPLPSL